MGSEVFKFFELFFFLFFSPEEDEVGEAGLGVVFKDGMVIGNIVGEDFFEAGELMKVDDIVEMLFDKRANGHDFLELSEKDFALEASADHGPNIDHAIGSRYEETFIDGVVIDAHDLVGSAF